MTRQPKDFWDRYLAQNRRTHGPVDDTWQLLGDPDPSDQVLVRVRCASCGCREIGGAYVYDGQVWVAMRPDDPQRLATVRGQQLAVTCSCSMSTTVAADTISAKAGEAQRTGSAQSVRVGPIT